MIKHRLMFRDLLSLDNFCRAEVATSCDLIAILVQFVSEKRQCSLFRKQKPCACSKVKLLIKVTVFRELHLKPRR